MFDSARKKAKTAREDLTAEEQSAEDVKDNFYRFSFRNIGGLVMPVILKMDFTDGSTETVRIPAEIWRKNAKQVTWQYVTGKELKGAEIDPLWETADADRGNNVYDGAITPTTLKIQKAPDQANRMKDANVKVEPGGLGTFPRKSQRKTTPRPTTAPSDRARGRRDRGGEPHARACAGGRPPRRWRPERRGDRRAHGRFEGQPLAACP